MIEAMTVQGFKSLKHVSLKLGVLNVLIGTNSSGKSNLFDALRIVQGIAHGFTIDEIFTGKPKTAATEAWEPIRGGSSGAAYREWDPDANDLTQQEIKLSLVLYSPDIGRDRVEYSIGVTAQQGRVTSEKLIWGHHVVFDTSPIENPFDAPVIFVRYYKGTVGRQPHLEFERTHPILQQIGRRSDCSKTHAELFQKCLSALGNMQQLNPAPAVLREPSMGSVAPRMGERGENFAALVNHILQDETLHGGFLSWLRQLTPAEAEHVDILKGTLGESLFGLQKNRRVFPAPVLSDGTLRFAAIAAAFFQPHMPHFLMIEELENGLHPTRLRLLVDLLKSQAHQSGPQVLITTHSPILLSWLDERDYNTVFFCTKDETKGASTITPISGIPQFEELVRRQPISDLFSEGWLESAL